MIHPLIISRLIEENLEVFYPLSGKSELLVRSSNGEISRVIAVNACQDREGTPFLKNPFDKDRDLDDLVAVCERVTRTVWVIPSSLLEERTMIRLGKKYDDYIIPEPQSIAYQEQKRMRTGMMDLLKDEAREKAREMGGKKNDP